MSTSRLYQDEKWLSARIREGRNPSEIAEMCGVSKRTIEKWIDKLNIRPYRDEDWLEDQIDQYVSARAVAEWCCVSEQTVKRWMNRFNIEHPGLAPSSVMTAHLENRFHDVDNISEKTQISVLRQRYVPRVDNARIAKAVGCTPNYVRQVRGEPGGDLVELLDYGEFSGSESVPDRMEKEVKERDGRSCVRCGSTKNNELEIHHILPGDSTKRNLATLCRDCHLDAHKGDFYAPGFSYDTRGEFWDEWVEESR